MRSMLCCNVSGVCSNVLICLHCVTDNKAVSCRRLVKRGSQIHTYGDCYAMVLPKHLIYTDKVCVCKRLIVPG